MSTSPVSILLVEDDDIDAITVTRGLAAAHISCPIVRAHDGVEAIEVLTGSNGHPKPQGSFVMLVDISMPRMDGLELVRRIRGSRQLQRTVVFILTTSASERDQMEAYDEHVAGYIVKSDVTDGFATLARMLEYYLMIVSLPIAVSA